jgi:Ran GTPase-activating protein (RanGAP) involved in mRNA processing and transport
MEYVHIHERGPIVLHAYWEVCASQYHARSKGGPFLNCLIGKICYQTFSNSLCDHAIAYRARSLSCIRMESFSNAIARGALANLEFLMLDSNNISDAGLTALATAIGRGALANCRFLDLTENNISATGMVSFSDAIAGRVVVSEKVETVAEKEMEPVKPLRKLTHLVLSRNSVGDTGLIALAKAIGTEKLPDLQYLTLDSNNIRDAGLSVLSDAIGKDALPKLQLLALHNNHIGGDGLTALLRKISSMNTLEKLYISENDFETDKDRISSLVRTCKQAGVAYA